MYTNLLPEDTKSGLKKLKNLNLNNFYLSGGTALALQIGHRESEDLHFFNKDDFEPEKLQIELSKIGKLSDIEISNGTLNCFLDKTKLQFLYYPYDLLEEKISWEGIYLSSILDIACTKLITVSARGSKKDFIDIYFLLKDYKLEFLIKKLKEKYSNLDYNTLYILKSLVYFEDADKQPNPRMHKEVEWKRIKEEIVEKVKDIEI